MTDLQKVQHGFGGFLFQVKWRPTAGGQRTDNLLAPVNFQEGASEIEPEMPKWNKL